MLDECKGDKFEEVVVSFSTVVLQKVLAAEKIENSSIAKRLAIARKVPLDEKKSLLPLAIAHRVSLTEVLRRKRLLETRYSEFQHLLEQKEQELAQRTERLEAIEESGAARVVPNHVIHGIKRQFDIHWQGDPRWVDVIVKGGEHHIRDSLLEREFSELWSSVNQGTLHQETATNQQRLLQDLEKRIASHQARLQHWKTLKDDLIREPKLTPSAKHQDLPLEHHGGVELDLSRHKDVIIEPKKLNNSGEKGQVMADRSCAPSMTDEYARLVGSMEAELNAVSKGVRQSVKSPRRDRNYILPVPLEDHNKATEPGFSMISCGDSAQGLGSPIGNTPWTPVRPKAKSLSHDHNGGDAEISHMTIEHISPSMYESIGPTGPREQDAVAVNSGIEWNNGFPRENHADAEKPEVLDEDELLAQQIIFSTRNAAPSPSKPERSLVDRTRQSMEFSTLAALKNALDDDAPSMPPPPPASLGILDSPPHPTKSTTLLERTRQSMSLMPSTSLRPRKSVHKSRPSKPYPTNQFETPSKQQITRNIVVETTPPEKLFTQEADYASVFQSRPKIGLSPTVSPEFRKLNQTDESFGEDDMLGHNGGSPSMRRTGTIGRC